MSTEDTRRVVQRLIDAHSKGDRSVFQELLADDLVDRAPLPGHAPGGKQGARSGFDAIRGAFPNVDVTVNDVIAEGEKAVVHVTLRGTHSGAPWNGRAATNQQVEVQGVAVLRIANGKIVEHSGVIDSGRLAQLGAI
jgi:steroid delta-isomerase-like uncharacterized protein